MADHGTFCWNELMTRDPKKARDFYSQALGWTYDEMPMPNGTYTIAKSGDKMVGGIMQMTAEMPKDMPEHWFSYIAVDDIDARVKKAAGAGAKVAREPFDVPGVGRIAILQEPGGAMVGWMTPAN